ncbi:MAG: PIN domain-containing protein [Anaerolineae bacterium]|nr:PIN domain-containing protein [Anaerolineae bacterium]
MEDVLAASNNELVPTPTDDEIAANANLVRDPKDVHVAHAAINAHVDYLVSQDKDLTAQDDSTKALRERLNVMLPGTFLREYMGWTSEALEALRQRTWRDVD